MTTSTRSKRSCRPTAKWIGNEEPRSRAPVGRSSWSNAARVLRLRPRSPGEDRGADAIAGVRAARAIAGGVERHPGLPARAPSPISPSKDLAWEQQRREHADDLMSESRWSEAATQWEILAVLRPGNSEYETGRCPGPGGEHGGQQSGSGQRSTPQRRDRARHPPLPQSSAG